MTAPNRFILLFLLFSLVCNESIAQEVSVSATNAIAGAAEAHDIDEALHEVIEPYVSRNAFRGSVLVAKGSNVVFTHAAGYTNQEDKSSFNNETPVSLMSISKPITATVILLLEQQEKLKLTDSLAQHLPEFDNEIGRQITLHHLLSHTSGLPDHFVIDGWFDPEFHATTSETDFLKLIAQLPLSFTPGADFQYSNPGYFLLGMIIQKVMGKPYSVVFDELLFSPLNMKNTGFTYDMRSRAKVQGYQWTKSGGYRVQTDKNMKLFGAGAAIQSSVEDLFLLQSALYGNQILNDQSRARMFDSKQPYSWRIQRAEILPGETQTVHAYDGKFDGFSSMITRLVEDEYSIILLSNIGMSYHIKSKLTSDIILALRKQAIPDRKMDASLYLINSIVEGSYEEYLEALSQNKLSLQQDELGLSALAFELLWSNLGEYALSLFSVVNMAYPDSSSAKKNLQLACHHRLTSKASNKATICDVAF